MGIINPRPALRSRERKSVEVRLKAHAEFMRQLEAEGWDRKSASAEALRMIETIDDYLDAKDAALSSPQGAKS